MIELEVRVVSSHRDGLLIALGDVLLANQFTLLRHRRANTESGVVMTLVVKGPEANLLRLEEQLGTHWMVSSFEAGTHDPNAAPLAAAAPATPPAANPVDPKRIDVLLPQLAKSYPNIFGPLLALERDLDSAQREATMRYVGSRVGAWVFKRDFALGAKQPLAGSISHIALPAMKQLLPVRLDGDVLSTLGSPFAAPEMRSASSQCHFIRGFLEGLLNESGHLGHVRVAETGCRACGSDACKFTFHA